MRTNHVHTIISINDTAVCATNFVHGIGPGGGKGVLYGHSQLNTWLTLINLFIVNLMHVI